jgi:hypothetical protein
MTQEEIKKLIYTRECMLGHDYENEAEKVRDEIYAALKAGVNELPVEFILETLDGLGRAPSLINDDHGHWAVAGDGKQNVMDPRKYEKEETTFAGEHWFTPGSWKKTIREAIAAYFERD